MDWLRLAFGLIRDAVTTDEPPVRNSPPGPPQQQPSENIEGLLAEHRAYVDRNFETVVQMLNAQNEKLTETNRRQRIWNISLAVSLAVTFLFAILALIYSV